MIGFSEEWWSPTTTFVARYGAFYFDDIRTKIAQHHRTVWACHGAGKIYNSDALQRLHAHHLDQISQKS
jgi:hypothetical protein